MITSLWDYSVREKYYGAWTSYTSLWVTCFDNVTRACYKPAEFSKHYSQISPTIDQAYSHNCILSVPWFTVYTSWYTTIQFEPKVAHFSRKEKRRKKPESGHRWFSRWRWGRGLRKLKILNGGTTSTSTRVVVFCLQIAHNILYQKQQIVSYCSHCIEEY